MSLQSAQDRLQQAKTETSKIKRCVLIVNLPTNHRYSTLQTIVSAMVSFVYPCQRHEILVKYPFTAQS